MSHEPSPGIDPDGELVDGWPTRLTGVTETIVATKGPNGLWNQAALGITPDAANTDSVEPGSDTPMTARTYGKTRTRRNFDAISGSDVNTSGKETSPTKIDEKLQPGPTDAEAFVQFTRDPLDFVEAALGVFETDAPILASADAWTRIIVDEGGRTDDQGTEIVEWSLSPVESGVRDRVVPTVNRGCAAVIEATVPASRLDVEAFDDADGLERLAKLGDVVATAGDERSTAAFARIDEHVGWRQQFEE
ncbi:DUF447 family spectrin-like domain-containing protein [Salinarchaeum laminariae]|uniref:DUF447 family spectrin-like domain-containing protein n=1 Tax=Salinarchaeum laminariae TaxID=869888 RepID=UPI0020BF8E0B|nr:DUF447 domain-containing protein [Salinarchaeum laminariae]